MGKPFSRKELLVRVRQLLLSRKKLWQQFLKQHTTKEIPEQFSRSDQEFILKLNQYIETNLSNELSLDQVSQAMHLSRTPLFRKLKALTGLSVTQYIRDYRLKRAFELLQESEHSVSEIITITGFNSPTYFYRSFKEKYGKAPLEIVKTAQ